jgi:hypothetical protein
VAVVADDWYLVTEVPLGDVEVDEDVNLNVPERVPVAAARTISMRRAAAAGGRSGATSCRTGRYGCLRLGDDAATEVASRRIGTRDAHCAGRRHPMKIIIDTPPSGKLDRVLANEKRILVTNLAAALALAAALLAVLLSLF